jgi:undecaprenyl-phosphate 4-deoxy-4-formamido-L-arabinose transferase
MYSVIIPCYNSSRSIREVVEQTAITLKELERVPFEFVLVDDHSPDGGATLRELRALADDYPYVTAIELAQNAGQHNAIMAALNHASGDFIISMDDDLQTHPSQIHILLEEIDKGYDVVYGFYPDKKHSLFRNFGSWVNYTTVRIMIGKPKELKTSSFWIIKKFVRDYVIQYKNKYTYMQGLFLRTTNNISSIPVEHFERAYGQSNYTFKKLIGLWSNVMGYSILPLRLASRFGALVAFIGIIGAIIVLIRKIMNPSIALGWSSIMFTVFFFSGVIMMFLGILGEYVGRLFLNMGNDPQFVVRSVYNKKDS